MEILLALLPPFFFGPLGMVLVLVGGTVKQQLVGELSGALIVALAILPWMGKSVSMEEMLAAFGSGMLCAIGITGQLYSFTLIGVSRTMPISTGLQLLYMTLAGVFIFNEWPTSLSVVLGVCAVISIAVGIALTSYTEKKRNGAIPNGAMTKALFINAIASLFLAGYIVWMRIIELDFGEFFPPQAVGMAFGALTIAALWRDGSRIFSFTTMKLTLGPGVLYGLAVLLMQISTQVNGVATGFTLSQLGVVISVLTGIVVLKEKKTHKEAWATAWGVALILIGAALIGYTKSLLV